MQVVLVTSSKGGVGKTQTAKLLSYQLMRDGLNVGMMDADIDSSNLSTRMGAEGRVEYNEDDQIIPVEKDGIKVYSMESAFRDSSFSQSGEFMRTVIRNMADGTDWGKLDYLIVDTPPGTKDIYDEIVNVFRDEMLGAIVVGQSDSVDDVGRMTKVCNYNYVPIIGYVENMSGFYMNGELVKVQNQTAAPFGRGNIKALAENVEGRYLGPVPLCNDPSEIEQAAKNTIKSMAIAVKEVQPVEMPSIEYGDQGVIRNVWSGLVSAIKAANSKLNVNELQEQYGQPDSPRVVKIKLTDFDPSIPLLGDKIPGEINLTMNQGISRVKNPDEVFAEIEISSHELKCALQGERDVMDSPIALYQDEYMSKQSYGLVDAVQMGKADVSGDDVVNYMSLLDMIFEKVIDESEIQAAVREAT